MAVEFTCPSCGCRAVIVSDGFVRPHPTAVGEPCTFVRTAHSGSASTRQRRRGDAGTRQRSASPELPTPDTTRHCKKRGQEDPARIVGQRLDAEVNASRRSICPACGQEVGMTSRCEFYAHPDEDWRWCSEGKAGIGPDRSHAKVREARAISIGLPVLGKRR